MQPELCTRKVGCHPSGIKSLSAKWATTLWIKKNLIHKISRLYIYLNNIIFYKVGSWEENLREFCVEKYLHQTMYISLFEKFQELTDKIAYTMADLEEERRNSKYLLGL